MAKIIPFPGHDSDDDDNRDDDNPRGPDFDNAPAETRFRYGEEPLPPTETLGVEGEVIDRLINADPGAIVDLVAVEPKLASDEVEALPVLRRVTALLRLLGERDGAKATANGFLPAALVKELFSDAYAEAESSFVKVNREGDSPTLLFERKLAQKGGLIRLSNRRFTLTKVAEKALAEGDHNELYRRLLTAYLKRPQILEEFDRIDDAGLVSAAQAILLQACRSSAGELLYEEDLAILLLRLFPHALEEIRSGFWSPFDELCHAVALRFFERFGVPFGLFEEARTHAPPVEPEESDERGYRWPFKVRHHGPWRRTERFDRVFRWSISAPKAPTVTDQQASELWLNLAHNADGFYAEQYVLRAIEREPANAEAYHLWASLQADTPHRALRIVEAGIESVTRARAERRPPAFGGEDRELDALRIVRADLLWELRRKEESLEEFESVLNENPIDHFGVRYRLVPLLISDGRLDEAEAILDQYEEESAFALWDRTLLAYARGGAAEARPFLEKALEANPFVPEALTDRWRRYREAPERYTLGSPEEAEIYAEQADVAWRSVKNAKQWIREK
ncbi:MAG: tetratricopeptide repeat protein [Spirochaetaceae bacterium]